MRKIFLIITLVFLAPLAFGQYSPTTSMQDDFKQMSGYSKRSSYGSFQSYSSGEVKGSQFFYPTWAKGSVTTINNEVIFKNYMFLFDRVRHELFIVYKPDDNDPKEVLQGDKPQIRSFSINTDREHVFVPGRIYATENPGDFYEVLEKNDSAYTLLKYVKTRLVKFDKSDIEKVKRGDMYDEFVDNTTYYIVYRSAKPVKISFREKSIISALPLSKKTVIENYFNDHGQQEQNDDFLIKLVGIINQ